MALASISHRTAEVARRRPGDVDLARDGASLDDEPAAWPERAGRAGGATARPEPGDEPLDELETESSTALYFREIGRIPLLTAADEIRLAQEREAGLAAAARLAGARSAPSGASTLDVAALEEAVSRGAAAERRLIESNLRLVVAVARKYANRGLAFLDLVQEGNIGLKRGIEKYDWRQGYRLSTYVYWWIRQAVTRALAEQSRTIRLPVHLVEQLGRLQSAAHDLEAELGREPTPDEIAERVGLAPGRVRDALRNARAPASLDLPLRDEIDATLADVVADPRLLTPDEQAEQAIFADELHAALRRHLTPREARVVQLRFGLRGERARTLKEIGDELGVSRERARQLESGAMRKLRHAAPFLRQFRDGAP